MLVNVLGKSPSVLFNEFEGKYDTAHLQGSGDVKYHKGFSSDLRTPGGNVHVALAFNPSHLEVVNPVVEGSVRARQERRGDAAGARVLPILIHGDSAFAGQGVVMETLQLSQARAFYTGGTVHIIVNNQVGFTTSRPDDARSTMYCSRRREDARERRSSTSTATIRKRWCSSRAWRSRTASGSARTWSSTSSVTAATATTRRMSRRPRSR